jgi:outer membrane lipoprotein-sorting protein
MKNSPHENDDLLDRAVDALCSVPVSQEPPPETVARTLVAVQKACDRRPFSLNMIKSTQKWISKMKSISKIALAASILVAVGIVFLCLTIGGGSSGLAFAAVADALEQLHSVTYDMIMEVKDSKSGETLPPVKFKCSFLAPSRQRMEMSNETAQGSVTNCIMIQDYQTAKSITLTPWEQIAVVYDYGKMAKEMGKSGWPIPQDMFAMVRQMVREGRTDSFGKVESLGKKEIAWQKGSRIDKQTAVGFRIHSNMADMTFWADPQTARLIRVDTTMPNWEVCGVMDHFLYDVDLDPSLFSMEPPPGYSVQNMDVKMPLEADLINLLRIVAKHNMGVFPAAIGMNKEIMQAIQADMAPNMMEKMMEKMDAEKMKIMADDVMSPEGLKAILLFSAKAYELNKEDSKAIEAAWQKEIDAMKPEIDKIKAEYGDKKSSEAMKAMTTLAAKMSSKVMMPYMVKKEQKYTQGVMFFEMLTPANDSHYVGGGVKLDTPDQPIFWYKPTGAETYRVIYADLSVKEMTPDEVKKLPQTTSQPSDQINTPPSNQ